MHDGEFVAVMGPSGSGKTTLLSRLSGGFEWAVPWSGIIAVALVTLVPAVTTEVVPGVQAGRIQSAQALRLVD